MKFLISCLFCLSSLFLEATPAQIILIRHAEKPIGSMYLTLRGRERAASLAPYLIGTEEYMHFGPIAAIYATNVSPEDTSFRTQETMLPLASLLKMQVFHPFSHFQTEDLAKEILNNSSYNDKTIIICWDHYYIPQLARDLGVKDAPSKWENEVYDQVWLIRYNENRAELRIIQQELMFGDTPAS